MKQCRIFTQRQAKEDTDEIWHYIAQDNPTAADAFLDAIEETSKNLSVFPATGGLRYFYHTESSMGYGSCRSRSLKSTSCSTALTRTNRSSRLSVSYTVPGIFRLYFIKAQRKKPHPRTASRRNLDRCAGRAGANPAVNRGIRARGII